jgi:putative flippase GtrA
VKWSVAGLLSRFGAVGVLATLTYLAVSNLLILEGVSATAASVLGYLTGMVASFVGQSRYTFRVDAGHRHFVRFCVLSALGLAISYMAVHITSLVALPPVLGTMATAILIPMISFVLMKLWVFRD